MSDEFLEAAIKDRDYFIRKAKKYETILQALVDLRESKRVTGKSAGYLYKREKLWKKAIEALPAPPTGGEDE